MSQTKSQSISIKALIIGALIIGLIIPTFFIDNIISDRKLRQKEAFDEVSSKWASTQTIIGPIVSIPYNSFFKDSSGVIQKQRKYIHILPDLLDIDGNMSPERRYRGIYEIIVYRSKINFKGKFSLLSKKNKDIPKENILYDQAFINIGITDLRGIKEKVQIKWKDSILDFNSGIESKDIIKDGISIPIKINSSEIVDSEINFDLNLSLNGSQFLHFLPVGKETLVKIKSNWQAPSFGGSFLPDKRMVNESGFEANWKILHLNRNYPQYWLNDEYKIDESQFGVNLLNQVDNYTKTERTIKYAILIIALTFLIFFFLELLNGKIIHPLQYILIGFALSIFYVLLLSISEHINFNLAYLMASVMTISLITWYSISILGDKKLGKLVLGNLLILYGFIFSIIQLEDYALLIGSIGLFTILTVVMYFSKKIDWKMINQ